jgi:putative glycosyltransferase (TIGR04372 family)
MGSTPPSEFHRSRIRTSRSDTIYCVLAPRDAIAETSRRLIEPSGLIAPIVAGRDATVEIFGRRSRDLLRRWKTAGDLWADGEYVRSVELRNSCLCEADEAWPREDSSVTLLSPEWISNMGHLGWLSLYLTRHKRRSDPGDLLVTFGRPANRKVFDHLASGYASIDLGSLSPLVDFPPLWSCSERLSMVRSSEGFVEMNCAWEEEFGHNSPLPISSQQSLVGAGSADLPRAGSCTGEAVALGLGSVSEKGYVLWLNRRSPATRDPRFSPEEPWLPAIQMLIKSGYSVIRIGDLPANGYLPPGVIDMTLGSQRNAGGQADISLLLQARMLLTSNSGPITVASVLRVPTLQVNAIAVARNAISSQAPLITLPKQVFVGGRSLSAEELFSSRYAYMERPNGYQDVTLKPNEASAITQAVADLIRIVEGDVTVSSVHDVNAPLRHLRKHHRSVSLGNFAPSLLTQDASWRI